MQQRQVVCRVEEEVDRAEENLRGSLDGTTTIGRVIVQTGHLDEEVVDSDDS
jgi:hypothetical protein